MSLTTVSAISLSGMNAAALRQNAAASNVANALTAGYRRVSVAQREIPQQGGVAATLVRDAQPAPADVIDDMVNQIGAVYAFKANLVSIRTADRMVGRTLNLFA